MPTTRVPAYRCGTDYTGWLDDAHPTVEDGEVYRKVCFSDRVSGCRHTAKISVKNCGSYFIYKLFHPPSCASRYCGTDWIWSKYTWLSKRIQELNCRYMCIRFWICDVVNLSSLSCIIRLRFSILIFMYNLFFFVFSSFYCCNYRPWFILAKIIRIQAGSISLYRRRKKSDESRDLMSYNNYIKLT